MIIMQNWMKMQKIIRISLVVVWMIIIFSFSQVKGEKSGSTSTNLIKNSIININRVLVKIKIAKPIGDKQANKIAQNLNYPVRKIMHMAEYFILALLLYFAIILYNTKKTYSNVKYIIRSLYVKYFVIMENNKDPVVKPKFTNEPINPTLALLHSISISITQENPISSEYSYGLPSSLSLQK